MPISKVHSSYASNNKGSSIQLVNYLEKENIEIENLAQKETSDEKANEIRARKQYFFNHENSDFTSIEVLESIDKNIQKLGKDDTKFFSPTINFSNQELKHITEKVTGRKNVKNVEQMSRKEFEKYNEIIRDYTEKVMDNYANNFNRQDKGLTSGKELVYYAKIEHQRKFKGTDIEVKKGRVKSGELKPGLQTHVHVIVSRKDKSQKLKLTPTTNERNKIRKIGKNTYRVGFDRQKWIKNNEITFDKAFEYKRPIEEKVEVQNILKNGTPKEKEEMKTKIKSQKELIINKNQQYGI